MDTENKPDRAFTILEIASRQVKTNEIPLKYTIHYRIGSLHRHHRKYMVALEHFQVARIGREKLLG